jgi:hypothetical protein
MKEYLLFILGDLTEIHLAHKPKSRFWKNDEYGIIMEYCERKRLSIYAPIWNNFRSFFDLDFMECVLMIEDILGEQLCIKCDTCFYIQNRVSYKWVED